MTKNLADERQLTARQAMSGLYPAPQGEEVGGLPFDKLLAAVFRGRYFVFGTTLFGLLIGAFLAITTANSYVSTGKFLFTASGSEKTRVDPSRSTETSQETIGTAAPYILNTDGLLQRVVDRLTPARILAPYKPGAAGDSAMKAFFFRIQRDWNATREEDRTPEEALKRLRKTLVVERPRYTDVLVATCTANNPELAQEILAAYMDEAPKWHIEMYEEKRAYEEAEQAFTEAQQARDVAQVALRQFLVRSGIVNFEEEKTRLSEEATEDAVRVATNRVDLDIAKSQLAQCIEQLEGENAIPRTRQFERKIEVTNERRSRLQQACAELDIRRAQLIGRGWSPTAEEVTEIERQIASLTAQLKALAEEDRLAPLTMVVEDNPQWLATDRSRNELKIDVDRLTAQYNMAVEIQQKTEKRLKALLELEPEFTKLSNALVAAEDKAKSTNITWMSAQEKRDLSQGRYSSLKAFENATFPLEKEGPNRGRLLLGGLLVGLFLGLGVVVLRALPDSVVRTREDLERIDGIQVIGVLPRLDSRNLKRHSYLRGQGW